VSDHLPTSAEDNLVLGRQTAAEIDAARDRVRAYLAERPRRPFLPDRIHGYGLGDLAGLRASDLATVLADLERARANVRSLQYRLRDAERARPARGFGPDGPDPADLLDELRADLTLAIVESLGDGRSEDDFQRAADAVLDGFRRLPPVTLRAALGRTADEPEATRTPGGFPYRQHPADFAGSNPERQSVGDPGHCEDCCSVGHVAAHPDLGCADVGCTRTHGPDA
jgi:hypothetical protein